MARLARDARLETRQARSRLKQRHEPYWRQIHPGLALGYRKGARGGVWQVRALDNGSYVKKRIGLCDDYREADGRVCLSFAQAQKQALEVAGRQPEQSARSDYTVEQALADYLEWHDVHSRNSQATRSVINRHILPAFGKRKVAALTTEALRKWQLKLAKTDAGGAETIRKRKSTANRVLTVLKAALNHAFSEGKVETDEAWRRVRPYKAVDAPKRRYLTQAEAKHLINAAPAHFRPLIEAALLTGCRYGELRAARAGDYNPDSGTLTIGQSKSGKARHIPLTDEGQQYFAQATAGLTRDAPIFTKPDGSRWKRSEQLRPMREASDKARIEPQVSFHILRHTYGSLLALKGVPLQVIASALGHADTRMTEKHYAHLVPDYVAKTIRAKLPKFGVTTSNVSSLRT